MWECNYSREPVNYRLLWLKLLKKWWVVPASALAGAVVVFLSYFLYKTVITGRTYQVTNIYYIDFAEDASGAQYDWVNQYTWSTLADMNVFIDGVYDELGGKVSKEEICSYSDCTVESDGRYLYLRVTTKDQELSKEVSEAYEKTLFAFCDSHKEFNNIVKEHDGEVIENSNIRVAEISILGAVFGLLCCFIVVLVKEISDTSIYIPATLEYRFHIPTLTASSMKEYHENCARFLSDKKNISLVYVDKNHVKADVGFPVTEFENPCDNPKLLKSISAADGVVLCVKAGNHNGKMTERVIEQLGRYGIEITATMLSGEDEKLISRYYKG